MPFVTIENLAVQGDYLIVGNDNNYGYSLSNIEWTTWRDNCMEPIYKMINKTYTLHDMEGTEMGRVYFK